MRISALLLAILATLAAMPAQAENRPVPCETNPAVVRACFTVHGILGAYNGAPAFRIWDPSKQRMLGVRGEQDGLPPSLIPVLMGRNGDAFGKSFSGDYIVCPMSKRFTGRMEMVCVEAAKNVTVRRIAR